MGNLLLNLTTINFTSGNLRRGVNCDLLGCFRFISSNIIIIVITITIILFSTGLYKIKLGSINVVPKKYKVYLKSNANGAIKLFINN
jgi:hypothetical protein